MNRGERLPLPRKTDDGGGKRRKCLGLLARKERWGLSKRGWLLIFGLLFLSAGVTFFRVYPFLAVTHREKTNILVVEGWIHQFAADAAVQEFESGGYQRVFTTGGPVNGLGHYVNDYQTSASVGADLLRNSGIPADRVQMVPSHVMERDRTYSSAMALRDWFSEHSVTVDAINVLTEDAHARRTRLLFQKALGYKIKVGIISVPTPDYDAKQWWHYSEGVKEVISEGSAYIYARLLFHPEPAPRSNPTKSK
jgi:uncharacterized SAM-binding protein YcdF (DUF218 family)